MLDPLAKRLSNEPPIRLLDVLQPGKQWKRSNNLVRA